MQQTETDRDPPLHRPVISIRRHAQTFIPGAVREFTRVFIETEASSGFLLLIAALVALIWVNSPWGDSYRDLWTTELTLDLAVVTIAEDLRHVVNDGLMTIFFFVVGLEIKREITHAELAEPRRALLPVLAAVGGMVLPAMIYTAFNAGGEGERGWGIPMATDIAFAVGVLSLLGRRVPFAAKAFLLTLAVVDDIGAILVIALFYTQNLSPAYAGVAIMFLLIVMAMNQRGVRSVSVYVAAGTIIWVAMLKSGIHPTIAGVALGLLTPALPFYNRDRFVPIVRNLVDRVEALLGDPSRLENQENLLDQIGDVTAGSQSPLHALERALHPWTSFAVMPLFALANAGVAISASDLSHSIGSSITLGVAAGLILGKSIAIFGLCYIASRLKLCTLPLGLGWHHIAGVSLLAGIGFTVSLFIADLSFSEPALLQEAKIGILVASFLAGCASFAFLRVTVGR